MNERLAYYEKKYGEGFAAKSGGSKSGGSKRAARQSPRADESRQSKGAKAEPRAEGKGKQPSEADSATQAKAHGQEKQSDATKATGKKRGLLGKLKGLFKGDA